MLQGTERQRQATRWGPSPPRWETHSPKKGGCTPIFFASKATGGVKKKVRAARRSLGISRASRQKKLTGNKVETNELQELCPDCQAKKQGARGCTKRTMLGNRGKKSDLSSTASILDGGGGDTWPVKTMLKR